MRKILQTPYRHHLWRSFSRYFKVIMMHIITSDILWWQSAGCQADKKRYNLYVSETTKERDSITRILACPWSYHNVASSTNNDPSQRKDFDVLLLFFWERQMQKLFSVNLGWSVGTTIFLIVAIVLALTCPNASIPTITFSKLNGNITFFSFLSHYKLSDTAIVSEDGPTLAFKILLPVLFACGITFLGLIPVWKVTESSDCSTMSMYYYKVDSWNRQ